MSYDKNIFKEILKIAKAKGYSQTQIAKSLGFAREYITRLKTGERNVSREHLEQIAKIIDIDLDLFLESEQSEQKVLNEVVPVERGAKVWHLPNVTAWAGDVVNVNENLDEVEEWVIPRLGIHRGSQAALYSFEVQGDSMQPTIQPGDLLLCEPPITGVGEIENNGIYVIVYPDGVRCKRLRRDAKVEKGVIIYSDNKSYRSERLQEGGFSALRVVHRITNIRNFV